MYCIASYCIPQLPYCYRTGEWGSGPNLTTVFLDVMAGLGQVYDRKTVRPETVIARANRTGDVKQTRAFGRKSDENGNIVVE